MQIKFYQRAIRARPHDADMYFNYALFLEEVERRYGCPWSNDHYVSLLSVSLLRSCAT